MGRIILDHGDRKIIKDELKTSYPSIQKALFGYEKSKLAKKIREKAIELGGIDRETINK